MWEAQHASAELTLKKSQTAVDLIKKTFPGTKVLTVRRLSGGGEKHAERREVSKRANDSAKAISGLDGDDAVWGNNGADNRNHALQSHHVRGGQSMPITASQITTFQRCREEYRLSYRKLLRPFSDSPALVFGTAIHKGLELFFLGKDKAECLDVMEEYLSDPFHVAKARVLMAGYMKHYENDEIEALAVEKEFSFGRYGGKIDAVAKINGKVYVVEHKTASDTPDVYWQKLAFDHQIQLYMAGARSLGFEPEGVLYDVLIKPRARPKASEAPEAFLLRVRDLIKEDMPAFYRRRIVKPSDDFALLETIANDIEHVSRDACQPRSPGACVRYNQPCPFITLCSGEVNEGEFKKKEKENDELG